MKYFYDQNNQFIGYASDDSEIENAVGFTIKSPFETNYFAGPYTYNPVSEDWTGLTEEQFKELPENPTPPATVDQLKLMVGDLISENAKKDQSIKQLQTMTGSLVAQIAELNKGGK